MKLLVVCGPTGVGKTELALNLAKKYDGELVSADARQIYRGMDIGTGKDLPEKVKNQSASWRTKIKIYIDERYFELGNYIISGVPVWMYDVVAPDEEFTAYHFQKLARVVIADIWTRGKLPILVGGSGFYIDAVTGKARLANAGSDTKLRGELNSWSLYKLQEELRSKNQEVWEKMNESDRQNPRRLIRKIEIAEFGNSIRGPLAVPQGDPLKNVSILTIGLTAELPDLYKRIDARVDSRVRDGNIGEIQKLLDKGYSWDDPGMNALGYKEWREYFVMKNGKWKMENGLDNKYIIQRWKWDEHGYARRQMTWFRKNDNIKWINICEADYAIQVEAIVGKWYTTGNES